MADPLGPRLLTSSHVRCQPRGPTQADLSISLTGIGDLGSFRGTGRYQVPSEFNGHYNYRGKERAAEGSILAGPIDATFNFAYMSELMWTEHVNN